MLEPHHVSTLGTAAGGGMTLASFASSDWRIVAVNAALTLASAALSAWLKSRQKKGGK